MKNAISTAIVCVIFSGLGSVYAGQESVPTTHVSFIDLCTHEAVGTNTPNGVKLDVQIENLNADTPIVVNLKMGHPRYNQTGIEKKAFHTKKVFYPKSGRVHFTKSVKFKKAESNLITDPGRGAWLAEVRWIQKKRHKDHKQAGSGVAFLKLIHSKVDKLYSSSGPGICSWEGETQLYSNYIFNATSGQWSIDRESRWEAEKVSAKRSDFGLTNTLFISGWPGSTFASHIGGNRSGVIWGGGNGAGGVLASGADTHGFSSFGGLSVWAAKTDENSKYRGNFYSYGRTWKLGSQQGGFLGARKLHTRYEAQEYVLGTDKVTGCKAWVPSRKGMIESGRFIDNLYVVPQYLSAEQNTAIEFIEKMNPRFNHCECDLDMSYAEPIGTEGIEEAFFFPSGQFLQKDDQEKVKPEIVGIGKINEEKLYKDEEFQKAALELITEYLGDSVSGSEIEAPKIYEKFDL